METISIALICSILGSIVGILGYSRTRDKDIKKETKEEAIVSTKLEYIAKGVDDIRLDIKSQDRDIRDLKEKYLILDQSCKSAHHRIDEIKNRIDEIKKC